MLVLILQTCTHEIWFVILHFTEVSLTARRY